MGGGTESGRAIPRRVSHLPSELRAHVFCLQPPPPSRVTSSPKHPAVFLPSVTSSRRHFSLSGDPLRGRRRREQRASLAGSHARGRCSASKKKKRAQLLLFSVNQWICLWKFEARKRESASRDRFRELQRISALRAGRFLNTRRATLPPTGFFGHHHPGGGVCLPALAHHAWRKRFKRRKKEKKGREMVKY